MARKLAYRTKFNGRTYDVVDAKGHIVEGGFFSVEAACVAACEWNASTVAKPHPQADAYEVCRDGHDRISDDEPWCVRCGVGLPHRQPWTRHA